MTESNSDRIPRVYKKQTNKTTEGPTTMLFSSEGVDAISFAIERRVQRPIMDRNFDKINQAQTGRASDNLMARKDDLCLILCL